MKVQYKCRKTKGHKKMCKVKKLGKSGRASSGWKKGEI